MKWYLAIVFPILLGGCSKPTPTQSTSPYHMEISAGADTIAIGATVEVVGTIVGAYGNPMYYINITDTAPAASELRYSLSGDAAIVETVGTSAVLKLDSVSRRMDTLTVTFRGLAAGSAGIVIGVNGEILETDSSGRSFFNYITRYSPVVTITVR